MMQPFKIFENIFNEAAITSTRLVNFAQDCRNRIVATNEAPIVALLAQLDVPLSEAAAELGQVDTTFNIQRGKTLGVDVFIQKFITDMRDLYNGIAYKLGGEKSPEFLQFYPNGKSEYSNANKTTLPTLADRLFAAAEANTNALGVEITKQLKSYKPNWFLVRDGQQQAKGIVSDNRSDRSQAALQLELQLLVVVHTVAATYPGDVEKCLSFFDFTMLYPKGNGSNGDAPLNPPTP